MDQNGQMPTPYRSTAGAFAARGEIYSTLLRNSSLLQAKPALSQNYHLRTEAYSYPSNLESALIATHKQQQPPPQHPEAPPTYPAPGSVQAPQLGMTTGAPPPSLSSLIGRETYGTTNGLLDSYGRTDLTRGSSVLVSKTPRFSAPGSYSGPNRPENSSAPFNSTPDVTPGPGAYETATSSFAKSSVYRPK